MKNKFILACLLVSIFIPCFAGTADKLRVSFRIGKVEYRASGDSEWRLLKMEKYLPVESIVRTGPHAHLVLIVKGNQVHVNKNTLVNLEEVTGKKRNKILDACRYRIRRDFLSLPDTRRTTVSAVRGKRSEASMGIRWQDDLAITGQSKSKPGKTSPPHQDPVLLRARELYKKGDHKGAISLLSPEVKARKEKRKTAEYRYLLIQNLFKTGSYGKTVMQAEVYLSGRDGTASEKEKVYFIGAMAAEVILDYERAISFMERFLRWHPHSRRAPNACLFIADIYSRKGNMEKKKQYLSLLREKYPRSNAASVAEKMKE